MSSFNLSEFSSVSFAPHSAMRNFPLRVESYDLSGPLHFVSGVDLSSPDRNRVRVFLRELKSATSAKNRPGVINYATDPYAGLSEADLRDRRKMDAVAATLEARCFTEPGGVLMVQSAFDDAKAGAVSASWLNRIANGPDLADQSTVLITPAFARLSTPVFPKEGDTGTAYCSCEVLHPENATIARSLSEFDEQMFTALSASASSANGKFMAVIRIIDKATGSSATQIIERLVEKRAPEQYANEAPASTIARFWKALPDNFAAGFKSALENKHVEVIIFPATKYRVIGDSLKVLEKEATKRMHLPYERFVLATGIDNGFMPSTVALKRHKPAENQSLSGEEDFFLTAVYPLSSEETPHTLADLVL